MMEKFQQAPVVGCTRVAGDAEGSRAKVYFTRTIDADHLIQLYKLINDAIYGKVAIKLHTGEKHGPNILPRDMVKAFQAQVPDSTIVETNTYYGGDRDTTEKHRETIHVNGWDQVAPVDITDADGAALLPVKGGKWFKEMSVGKDLLNYDSLVVLTHFKGHVMGGFGGSDKNIGIGCADGKVGKKWIHSGETGQQWGVSQEEFMERMTESTKSVIDHFGSHVTYVNTLRNMSVSCDCEGVNAQPVVTPNIGILASTDILAVDQASVDMIYALHDGDGHDLKERMESRHGLRQLSYMKELGMGNDKYILIDLDNNEAVILPKDAVKDVKPFVDDGEK